MVVLKTILNALGNQRLSASNYPANILSSVERVEVVERN